MRIHDWIKEARGAAVWDAVKWLWAAGGSAMTLFIQWASGWIRHHQDLTGLFITGVSLAFFVIVAFIIHKNPNSTSTVAAKLPSKSDGRSLEGRTDLIERKLQLQDMRDKRSPLEAVTFSALKSDFQVVPFAQKIAMKLICESVRIHEMYLRTKLSEMGFGTPTEVNETIIKPILNCRTLIEIDPSGMMAPNQAHLKDIDEIILGWKCDL